MRVCIDPNLHVDTSLSFGVGFVIDNRYAGWRLIEGWACETRDIGWAESVALELAIYWLTQQQYRDANIVVCSENTGVIGAFSNGRSRNPVCNDCIRRITSCLIPENVMISPKYIASGENLADPVSHGLFLGFGLSLSSRLHVPSPC